MLSTTFAIFLAVVAAALASVDAHGYVSGVLVNKKNYYTGYLPYEDPYYNPPRPRVIRKVPGNGPVQDVTSIDIQCNGYTEGGVVGSEPAALYATVAAGSTIDLQWTPWPETHIGPTISYLAKAPSSVTTFVPGKSAVWFKIHEQGRTAAGKWAATDILNANNGTVTVTIPKNLKAGQYILRHELIALHSAYTYPGVQFYPSCVQIEVTGSGTAFPTSFVSFPGAYTPTSPGITFDQQTATSYPIPGPPLWTGGN